MNNDLDLKGFQELTEEEATAISGGLGIASTWVQLGWNITQTALNTTKSFLDALPAPKASAGVGLASQITNSVFSSIVNNLWNGFKL